MGSVAELVRGSQWAASRARMRACAALLIVLAAVSTAAGAEPRLSVVPAEISLTRGVRDRVVVSLSGTRKDRRNARIEVLSPPGLDAVPTPLRSRDGAPSGWVVALATDGSLAPSSAVVLVRARGRLLTGVIAVSTASATPAPTQLAADLVYDGDGLFDGGRGDVHLRLTNLGDTPLLVRTQLRLPGFVRVLGGVPDRVGAADPPLRLPPHASRVRDYRISVQASEAYPLASGRHRIYALVEATRVGAARPWRGSQIVTHDLTVGVPGLGEVQALVQVPSFLLLPGFLICVTAMMAWRFWRRPAAGGGEHAGALSAAMSPALWVIAITVSMAVVWAYPSISDWSGAGRRDLLLGFDLSDVVRVWMGSILIGFLVGNAAALGSGLQVRWAARRVFGEADTPLEALTRMKRLNLPLRLVMADTVADGRLFRAGAVGAGSAAPDRVWALPAIRYEASAGFDGAGFVAALDADDMARVVAQAKAGLSSGTLRLNWAAAGGAAGPRLVEAGLFDRPDQTALVLDPA